MKIQAKDLQAGQTVKMGNVWVLIEKVGTSFQKNGKQLTDIYGTQLAGVIKRANGIKQQIQEDKNYTYSVKSTTTVNIK